MTEDLRLCSNYRKKSLVETTTSPARMKVWGKKTVKIKVPQSCIYIQFLFNSVSPHLKQSLHIRPQ